MAINSLTVRFSHLALAIALSGFALSSGCDSSDTVVPPAGDALAVGTWGGDNAGMIVHDTLVHVHVGCTYGDITGRIPLDSDGRFSVAGSYLLRAYPIAVGPTMPAQFTGRVVGGVVIATVTVNDTLEKKVVVLGPITVSFGREPSMGPCPICRVPGMRVLTATEDTKP